ncbi:hypothetical protein [Defluviimonas salinarum]|uniref:Uncharacterized protein n=1 Tax=Defluviimonas salinarum TaxID=2992147 RepID=A0ABT3J232_9RHOB|nr:hypothetical protein [Defluviimonas salinarum]MCW3781723.1 hypothetical protein [Defluviimonas salinarum]
MPSPANTFLKVACFAIASLGAAAFVATVAAPDVAYAKNGNGKGGEGGKGGGKGGSKGAGKSKGGNGAKGATKSAQKTFTSEEFVGKPKVKPMPYGKAKIAAAEYDYEGEYEGAARLHPRLKGKWNASNASQSALDAHIRNQNFNGTIGALSQYQLAAKAAAGEELTETEQAALDTFVDFDAIEVSDQDLADFLNDGALVSDPVYSVEDGIVSCAANCDGVDLAAAQTAADTEAMNIQEAEEQMALDGFLSDSEARIVNESNKPLTPEGTEDLLDELASDLGVSRAMPVAEFEEVEEMPVEEPEIIVEEPAPLVQ